VLAHLRAVGHPEITPNAPTGHATGALDFASVYRENVAPVTAFFARRCREPQQVADLASQTFVEAIRSAHTYRGRGTPRAWLIAIARRVYAAHVVDQMAGAALLDQLEGQVILVEEELEDLEARIDAERSGRELLERASHLSVIEREAIDLVDLMGLSPKEAASALGVSANVLRVRLFRAHQRLRKETTT
jgi:RNA polymerase sigma factor (sigma-70 family)